SAPHGVRPSAGGASMKKNGNTRSPLTTKNCSLSIVTLAGAAAASTTGRAKTARRNRLIMASSSLPVESWLAAHADPERHRTVRSLFVLPASSQLLRAVGRHAQGYPGILSF